jgi:hypothetical protein
MVFGAFFNNLKKPDIPFSLSGFALVVSIPLNSAYS